MDIEKTKKELIVRIPLWQDSYDAAGKKCGEISNIYGLIAGDDIGFCQVIDLGYKDSFDYGDFLVKFHGSREEFIALCKKKEIDYFEYPECEVCGDVIYGTSTWSSKGLTCFKCNEENKKNERK